MWPWPDHSHTFCLFPQMTLGDWSACGVLGGVMALLKPLESLRVTAWNGKSQTDFRTERRQAWVCRKRALAHSPAHPFLALEAADCSQTGPRGGTRLRATLSLVCLELEPQFPVPSEGLEVLGIFGSEFTQDGSLGFSQSWGHLGSP